MHRKITAGLALSVAVATWCTAMPAAAIDLTSPDGTWKFSLDGNVNVDYIYSNREQASSVKAIVTVGGACTGTASGNSVSNIGNGLLPAAFTFGLFGFDAIVNDMTLLGVGVRGSMSGPSPANTSLGSIDFGYIYTDTLAQINYRTPLFGGANVTVGIFDPLNSLTEPGRTPAAKTAPGFRGKMAWSTKFSDDVKLSLSATGITQKQEYDLTAATYGGYQSSGGDVFAKLDIGGLSSMASGYDGTGKIVWS